MVRAGLVILNYNTASEAIDCINSFVSTNSINECQLYIVDNGSTDDSKEILKKYCDAKECHLIVSEKNLGFSGGNNLGIAAALKDGCEWILLSNSDIIFKNEIINHFDSIFESNNNICIVGPRIYDNEGNLIYRNQVEEITVKSLLAVSNKNKIKGSEVIVNRPFDGMVAGCVFAIRSSFIREANCLDDNVFLYYEEDILLRQIRKYNRLAYICDDSAVVHAGQASTKKSSDDKMCFVRFYAWPSSIYTLSAYSNTSLFKINALIVIYEICWILKSITSKSYRLKCKDVIVSLNQSKRISLLKRCNEQKESYYKHTQK